MNEFKNTCGPKIVVCTDCNEYIQHSININYEFIFDTIQINNISDLSKILTKYKKSIDLIVLQYKYEDNLNKILSNNYIASLPDFFKRRILICNDWVNHGDKFYDIIYKQLDNKCNPFISFITPLYKTSEKYFYELYNSLQKQTINDWEWILVDDSPDGEEVTFAKESSLYDCRVYYYRIEPTNCNIGLSKWRANCMSSGQWLFEIDHDDIILPNTVEFIKDAAKTYLDAGFIYSSTAMIDDDHNFIDKPFGDDFAFMYGVNDYTYYEQTKIPFHTTPINECTIMSIISSPNHLRCWRRDIYFSMCGHSQYMRACDDYELIVRTFLKTKFIHIIYPLYLQRFAGQNTQYQNDNIVDINNRVYYINSYYFNDIKRIFKERYNIDITGNSPAEVITYYSNNTDKAHNVEYIY